MEKLLYYPYISIPQRDWLTQALLYWDGIATIVPTSVLEINGGVTAFARSMIRAGIVETVSPEEYAFAQPDRFLDFLQYVEENRTRYLISNETGKLQRIYYEKLAHILPGKLRYMGDEFVKMGVAQFDNSGWYLMNNELAMQYMTFLALLIGKETDRLPVTDQRRGYSFPIVIENIKENASDMAKTAGIRNEILNALLPVPQHVNDYREILRFKEKYYDQLLAFRKRIESFLLEQRLLNQREAELKRGQFLEEAREEIKEIKGKMGFFQRPNINMGTLIAAIPVIPTILQGNYSQAAFSFGTILAQIIYNQDRRENMKKAFAYAAIYTNRFDR